MDDSLFPVMSPAFWKRAGRPTHPRDLVRLRLLHDRDPHASWEAWKREHGPGRLDVRKGSRFASSDLVLRAAAQGQGVALARGRLVSDDLAAGTLVQPFAGRCVELGTGYWIVLPQTAGVRPATAAVVAWPKRQAGRASCLPATGTAQEPPAKHGV